MSCTVPWCALCSGMCTEQPELRCLQGWQQTLPSPRLLSPSAGKSTCKP